MAFFKDLKASVKQIGEEIDEITLAHREIPVGTELDHARALAHEEVVQKKNRILDLKAKFEKLLTELTPQFNRNSSYLNSMSELMAEIEDETANLESHLQQFGYKPLVLDKCDDFSLKASAQEEETVKVEDSLTPVLKLSSRSKRQVRESTSWTPVLKLSNEASSSGSGTKPMKCPNSAELTPTKCSNIIEDSAESCIDSASPTPELKLGMPPKMVPLLLPSSSTFRQLKTPEHISSPMPTTSLPHSDLDSEVPLLPSSSIFGQLMTPECISSPMPTTALPQRDLDPEDTMIESDIEYSGVCKELKFLDM